MKMKEQNEEDGLKLKTQKSKILATGPMTSWQIDGKKMETVTGFIFLGSKITPDDDCSYKLKDSYSFEEKKAVTKQLLCHVKKQRHLFAIKGLHSQNYGFSSSHAGM